LYNGNPESKEKLTDVLQKYKGDTNAVTNDKSTSFYFFTQGGFEKALSLWSQGFSKAKF
jgi:secreted Zn-dependent insulinase-like peptidase